MANIQDQIRKQAQELLESKQVNCVIGYGAGSHGQVRPLFVREAAQVEDLVWNSGCTHNLVRYLRDMRKPDRKGELPPRVAIIVKPCDSRALNVLIAEKQVDRERVFVMGVACEGIVQGSGFAQQADAATRLQARCERCSERTPVVCDVSIGEAAPVNVQDDYADVSKLEAMALNDRVAFWLKQYDRCIRCYACRQVCPSCYCSVCMFERDDSTWVCIATNVKEKEFFHLGRAYHLAARCVGCNECERVCPMGLPLSLLNRKLAKEVQELFGYRAGVEPTQPPLLTMLAEGEEALI